MGPLNPNQFVLIWSTAKRSEIKTLTPLSGTRAYPVSKQEWICMLWRNSELQKPSILGKAWGREVDQVSESYSNIFANKENMPTVKLWGLRRKSVKRRNTWIEDRMLFLGIRVTVLWVELHPSLLPNSLIWSLSPRHLGMWSYLCPYKNGKFGCRQRCTSNKDDVKRHREKVTIYRPSKKAWNRSFCPKKTPNPTHFLILDFQALEPWHNEFLLGGLDSKTWTKLAISRKKKKKPCTYSETWHKTTRTRTIIYSLNIHYQIGWRIRTMYNLKVMLQHMFQVKLLKN